MSVEQDVPGRFTLRSEQPVEFDGNTDKFGSKVVSITESSAPIDRRDTFLVFPISQEGRDFYKHRVVSTDNRRRAIGTMNA